MKHVEYRKITKHYNLEWNYCLRNESFPARTHGVSSEAHPGRGKAINSKQGEVASVRGLCSVRSVTQGKTSTG